MANARTDAVLNEAPVVGADILHDISFDDCGDILTEDQLDTAILVSLFTDARAEAYEIPIAQYRRGWIGNLEDPEDLYGSHLWFLEQVRLSVSTVTQGADHARKALQWLIDDNIATEVFATGFIEGTNGQIRITITKPSSKSETIFVDLWELTGV